MSGVDISGAEAGGRSGLRGWLRGVGDAIFLPPASAVILRLTLLILILHGSSDLGLEVLLIVLCGAMLVFPALLDSRILWLSVCGCVWWLNAVDWLWIDNHKFLISYWCLACALAVQTARPGEVLRHNATVLIGLTFLFATVWKLVAGEYFDGSFLYFSLLTDGRMEILGTLFGGADPEVFAKASALLETLEEFPELGASVTLPEHAGLRRLALIGSWWTLCIEAAVAVAYLFKVGRLRVPAALRDGFLVVFIATAYVFIPVMGFGNILALMGLAACSEGQKKTRVVYLLLFALLQVSQLPWHAWVV